MSEPYTQKSAAAASSHECVGKLGLPIGKLRMSALSPKSENNGSSCKCVQDGSFQAAYDCRASSVGELGMLASNELSLH